MNCVKKRKLGRVQISFDILKELDDNNLLRLYNKLGIILRTEDRFVDNLTEICFANPDLAQVTEGAEIPLYNITIQHNTRIMLETSTDQRSRLEIEENMDVI